MQVEVLDVKVEQNFSIWKAVLETAEILDQARIQGKISKKTLQEFLESLEARTEDIADPVTNLEVYALRRLCHSIQTAIQEI